MNNATLPWDGFPETAFKTWRRLYKTDPAYRARWDAGTGPGQQYTEPVAEKDLPPLRTQVGSFLASFTKFVCSGCQMVDAEEMERRTQICMACDFFIRRRGRCSKCGCFKAFKARGKVFECPVGFW